jgi:hypothetical protein
MDGTGHMRHRGPTDLMRFADFHQWASIYASFGMFRPQEIPEPETQERYSDEQAYALALYIYSLTAPHNPNLPRNLEENALVVHGREVFTDPANRCVTCHQHRVPPLQLFDPGATTWNEEQSRKNFGVWSLFVVPGEPMKSVMLLHPLAKKAGGDAFHAGGKHFKSQNDPEWKILSDWVNGKTMGGSQ